MNDISTTGLTLHQRWDAKLYTHAHAFVYKYGEEVLSLLSPRPGERIIDLGCGTGELTAQILQTGSEVVGIDSSETMIEQARRSFPHINFRTLDGYAMEPTGDFDAVFSNAALHWMTNADAAAKSIAGILRNGGRLVAELGGQGNIQTVVEAINAELIAHGYPQNLDNNPWYFPSIAEYASVLERNGLVATFCRSYERSTALVGDKGMTNWLTMFAGPFFANIPADEINQIIAGISERLHPKIYRSGMWWADYCRLQIVAIKRSSDCVPVTPTRHTGCGYPKRDD